MADVITVGLDLQAKVARTLGVSLSEVKHLCGNSHGKTNPWAKFKPIGGIPMNVCRSGASGETLLVVNSARGFKYWEGMDGNCGFSIPGLTDYTKITGYCDGSMNGWVYNAPSATEYNRMGDFIGYWHLAPRGLGGVTFNPTELYTDDAAAALMFLAYLSTTYGLGFDSFEVIRNCYFGTYMRHSSGTYSRTFVNPTKITAGGDYVEINPKGLNRGVWKIYPFLSTTADTSLIGTYYPVPYASAITLNVKDASERVTISIRVLDDITLLSPRYVITIYNNTANRITCKRNALYFRKYGKRKNDELTIGETRVDVEDFVLEGNSSKQLSGTFRSTDLISSGGVTVIASFAQGAYEEIADIAK